MVPGLQGVHAVAAGEEYLPAGHLEHDAARAVTEIVPGEQRTHESEALGENEPALQELQEVAAAGLNLPASQSVHLEAPMAALAAPVEQSRHTSEGGESLYRPAPHVEQTATDEEYSPAEQSLQIAEVVAPANWPAVPAGQGWQGLAPGVGL